MSEITLGTLREEHFEELRGVAERDSRAVPAGIVLGARVDGRLVAARSISDGHAVADPFVRTAEVQKLLAERASQIRWPPLGRPAPAARQVRRSDLVVFASGRVDADRADHGRSDPDGRRSPQLLSVAVADEADHRSPDQFVDACSCLLLFPFAADFRTLCASRLCSVNSSMNPGLACWENSPPDSPKEASDGRTARTASCAPPGSPSPCRASASPRR